MTHSLEKFTAAITALTIVAATWAPLIDVPVAQAATTIVMPVLA